ncbi:hypothetical protein D3C71_2028710 [compost metagenome]
MLPVSSASWGVPVTETTSLKLIWMEMVLPALYKPSAVLEFTDNTAGAALSTV